MTCEIWKDIIFGIWGNYYSVSNHGRIKNKITGKIIKASVGKNGYASVTLKHKPHKWCIAVHTVVLTTFVGPPPTTSHEYCHGDNTRTNNELANLRWGTRRENHHDKIVAGKTGRKFDNDQIDKIKILLNQGTPSAISKLFHVSPQTIANIKEGRSYFV